MLFDFDVWADTRTQQRYVMQFSYAEKQNPTLYALNAAAEQYSITISIFDLYLIDNRYARNGTGYLTGFTAGYTVSLHVNPVHPRHDMRVNIQATQGFVGGPSSYFGVVCIYFLIEKYPNFFI